MVLMIDGNDWLGGSEEKVLKFSREIREFCMDVAGFACGKGFDGESEG